MSRSLQRPYDGFRIRSGRRVHPGRKLSSIRLEGAYELMLSCRQRVVAIRLESCTLVVF
jgi:hypothetical protein